MREAMMQTQKTLESQQSLMQSGQISGSLSFNGVLSKEDEEMSKSALSTFRAKEEEIEKKKMEVKEKVQAQMGRIEEETKRLATIREVRILGLPISSRKISNFCEQNCVILICFWVKGFLSIFMISHVLVDESFSFYCHAKLCCPILEFLSHFWTG